MSGKFTFQLSSDDRGRHFPHKIIIGQGVNESVRHVALKLLGWLLFFRPGLQLDTSVQNDAIDYVPDLVELGPDMRPRLWVECGECGINKLHKLAVKCPDAEIWVVKRSPVEARRVHQNMERDGFRRGRYGLVGLDETLFAEVCAQIRDRNELHWVAGRLDPPAMQFDLNNLWFDSEFLVLRY